MASLDYARKKKALIYAVAFVIGVCCIVLSACNKNTGIYDLSDINKDLELNHFIAKFIFVLYENIGNFGWTVVAFTVILKVALSPLDIWQKLVTRKNAKAMERMQPQLEILKAKYGDDKQKFQQEQMALYKREKYSMLGACVPTIVTLVVFFVIFAGFREMVGWKFAKDYQDCYKVFDASMVELYEEEGIDGYWKTYTETSEDTAVREAYAEFKNEAIEKSQAKVYEFYYSDEQVNSRSFLWIKNIFSPDSWSAEVPDYLTTTGKSGMATSRIEGIESSDYNMVMGDLLGQGGWSGTGSWNGWLLLPVLSLALNILSQKLMTMVQGNGEKKEKKSFKERWEKLKNLGKPANGQGNAEQQPVDQSQASMKMMTYMMPLITAVFALMYSSAFALYMFVSSLVATLFQLIFNLAFMIADKKKQNDPLKPKKVKANK